MQKTPGIEQPPFDERIEKACLGSLIASDTGPLRAQAEYGITPEMFHLRIHRTLAALCFELAQKRGGYVDPLILMNRLRTEGIEKELPNPDYLTEAYDMCPMSLRAGEFFDKLKEMHNRRQVIRVARDLIQEAYEDPEGGDLLQRAPQRFYELMPKHTEDKSVEECLEESMAEWRAIADGTRDMKGYSTGISDLDRKLGGLQGGCYYTIGARTSSGKTTLAGMIAEHFLQNDRPVGWVNMDMPRKTLYERNLCRLAGVSLAKLNAIRNYGEIYSGDKDFAKLEEAKKELVKFPAHYLHGEREVSKICSWVRMKHMQHGLKLLVLDFATKCKASEIRSSEQVRITTHVSSEVKEMCQQLDIPLLMLAQLNRGSEKDNRPPTLADFKECGALEEDCQAALLLSKERKFPYKKLGISENNLRAVWVDIAKQQNGQTGRMEYWLHAPYFKMSPAGDMWGHPEAFE